MRLAGCIVHYKNCTKGKKDITLVEPQTFMNILQLKPQNFSVSADVF